MVIQPEREQSERGRERERETKHNTGHTTTPTHLYQKRINNNGNTSGDVTPVHIIVNLYIVIPYLLVLFLNFSFYYLCFLFCHCHSVAL